MVNDSRPDERIDRDDERYKSRVWEEADCDVTDLVSVHPQIIDYEDDGGVVTLIVDTVDRDLALDIAEACEQLYPVTSVEDPRIEAQQAVVPLRRLAVC